MHADVTFVCYGCDVLCSTDVISEIFISLSNVLLFTPWPEFHSFIFSSPEVYGCKSASNERCGLHPVQFSCSIPPNANSTKTEVCLTWRIQKHGEWGINNTTTIKKFCLLPRRHTNLKTLLSRISFLHVLTSLIWDSAAGTMSLNRFSVSTHLNLFGWMIRAAAQSQLDHTFMLTGQSAWSSLLVGVACTSSNDN